MSAKKELKNTLKNVAEILCAKIEFDKDWNDKVQKTMTQNTLSPALLEILSKI